MFIFSDVCGHNDNFYFPSRQDAADKAPKRSPVLLEKKHGSTSDMDHLLSWQKNNFHQISMTGLFCPEVHFKETRLSVIFSFENKTKKYDDSSHLGRQHDLWRLLFIRNALGASE